MSSHNVHGDTGHWHTHAHMHDCTKLALLITDLAVALCLQVERDAYKAECDALKRKCKELRQDLEHVMLHACKGPFGKAPMPGDVDDVGHEDKKAKSELKHVNNVKLIFKHINTNSFAGQEEHHGNMLPESQSTYITKTMLLPDPVPDQEYPSDELEPLDLGQLDRQLDLGDMSLWSQTPTSRDAFLFSSLIVTAVPQSVAC